MMRDYSTRRDVAALLRRRRESVTHRERSAHLERGVRHGDHGVR